MRKKYYWNWATDNFMDEDINNFIEIGKKSNNEWWKSLKSTQFIFKTHLDLFKEAAKHYFRTGKKLDIDSTATAKTCPAIGKGLLDKVILVKLPCDVLISINEQGGLYWSIKSPNKLQIDSHPTDQFYSEQKNPFFNKINLKFSLPVFLSSSKDTYIFLQPQYHKQNYPLEVVNGSTNRDRIILAINTLIEIPKEQTEYHLKAGTILSYMWFDNNNIILQKNDKLRSSSGNKFFGNLNED